MEVRKKEKLVVNMHDLCRPIAEASPIPIAAVQGSGHIVRYVNPAFCALAEKPPEQLIGSAFSCSVVRGSEFVPLLDRVYRTGETDTQVSRETSAPIPWSCAVWPALAADGHIVGLIIQAAETTASHQQTIAMNEALMIGSVRQHEIAGKAAEALSRTNEELQRVNEDLRQFAFAASHDLQEPLRTIASYSQLLIRRFEGQLTDETSEWVAYITRGTQQMRDLLTDLLAYTGLDTSRNEPAARIDLNGVIKRVLDNLQPAMEASGAIVTCGDLPAVQGDDTRLVQLFQNLIGNAIKYRGEQAPRIEVSVEKTDGEWRFAVADNGIGISPDYHRQIFGVFKRLHGKSIPGTGIGLAICQRVVERHGGRIWVESQVGEGATFYFTLPAGGA